MNVIYKYPIGKDFHITAPRGAVRLVGYQKDGSDLPTIWIEHDRDAPSDTIYLVLGTGEFVDPRHNEHVGSAICGRYVWHVYRMM